MAAFGQVVALTQRRGKSKGFTRLHLRHQGGAAAYGAVDQLQLRPLQSADADGTGQKPGGVVEINVGKLAGAESLLHRQFKGDLMNFGGDGAILHHLTGHDLFHPMISFCMARAAARAASAKSRSPYLSLFFQAAMMPREELTMQPRPSLSKKPRMSSAVPPWAP